jgi:hypothetical protein
MSINPHRFGSRGTVQILDDDDDYDDVSSLIRTNHGAGRAPTRHNSEYRRSNRFAEDGYGDSDFA